MKRFNTLRFFCLYGKHKITNGRKQLFNMEIRENFAQMNNN